MEIRKITADEAINLLNDSEQIHTFRNTAGMLIGADWNKTNLLECINKFESTLQLSGNMARRMNHGFVLCDDTGYLFVETNEEKLNEFDPI